MLRVCYNYLLLVSYFIFESSPSVKVRPHVYNRGDQSQEYIATVRASVFETSKLSVRKRSQQINIKSLHKISMRYLDFNKH